jgi:hypothetical protein
MELIEQAPHPWWEIRVVDSDYYKWALKIFSP